MAFTDSEIKVIRSTWTPVQTSRDSWPQLFLILFKKDPELQKRFKAFENVPLDELPTNKRLKAHAASVITLLSGFVDFIDDPETMVEMIQQMATRHHNRSIPLFAFNTLGDAVIEFLKEANHGKFNEECVNAWTKLYTSLVSVVKAQYEQLDATKTN